MSTFDEILPNVATVLKQYGSELVRKSPILINRDLNGRVRLVVEDTVRDSAPAMAALKKITETLCEQLGPHAFPTERMVLFEPSLTSVRDESVHFPIEGWENVWAIDRLATESNWSRVIKPTNGVPRIVFFSIKGGVGRSTSLAAAAWALAESGKRVLVLDMDLESPGLSSSLLPGDRRPKFGITDWLVEDLVDNGDTLIDSMIATSQLSYNGEISVIPAHGIDPGEYIAKLGRVWMPKVSESGKREPWAQRLQRLLGALEIRLKPDVILIDSRAGIDEVASACVTDLGASHVLLFALDGEQTWTGYRILFRHWRQTGVARDIRERLQVVGAMIPDIGGSEYFTGLLENSWDAFFGELYDEVPAGEPATEENYWSFDQGDDGAPHYPWPVLWHRGFSVMRSLHHRFADIDSMQTRQVFGRLIEGLNVLTQSNEDEA